MIWIKLLLIIIIDKNWWVKIKFISYEFINKKLNLVDRDCEKEISQLKRNAGVNELPFECNLH